MGKVESKIALVTGGSSGIGLATARLLVAEGAYVFITGRRKSELDKAVTSIGSNVRSIQGDIANLEDIDRMMSVIKAEKGRIDIIVANASVNEVGPLPDVTPEHFDKIFNINTRGTFFMVQKSLPLLSNGGAIVLVSSVANELGVSMYTVYSASKAATRSFGRTWAAELKERGIRVNTVSPGPIDTPIFETQFHSQEEIDAAKKHFASSVPLGRVGRPEEIASAILFLASDDSSYSTGIDLVADGGLSQL